MRAALLGKNLTEFLDHSLSESYSRYVYFPGSTTLNKQVITILEQLGVPAEVFIHYQETNIIDFADALLFENIAADRLTASVKKDADCLIDFSKFRAFGMSLIKDPYFRSMLIVLYKNIISKKQEIRTETNPANDEVSMTSDV